MVYPIFYDLFVGLSLRNILGIAFFLGIAAYIQFHARRRGAITNIRSLIACFVIQIVLAFLLLKSPVFGDTFRYITLAFRALQSVTGKAVHFVFGGLSGQHEQSGLGFLFFFQALPLLISISALSSILMYLNVLPLFIKWFSFILRKITGMNFNLSIAASTSFFTGMSENPLVLRHYLQHFDSHEISTMMMFGFSTVSISMLGVLDAAYGTMIPDLMQYMVAAFILNIFGALWLSSVAQKTKDEKEEYIFDKPDSLLTAITQGTMAGGRVVVIIAAILVGFLSMLYLVDMILSIIVLADRPLTIERALEFAFTPIAWLMGADSPSEVARILGMKIALNEIIAYKALAETTILITHHDTVLSAFCISNFANIGSIAVVTGTYTALLPESKDKGRNIVKMASKAFMLSLINTLLTASIVSLITRW